MSNDIDKDNIIILKNVSKIYETNGNRTAGVKNIDLTVKRNEMLLILGPSGSGKTTLLTLIAGLIKPTSGDVFVFNKNIKEYGKKQLQRLRAQKIGFIFQTFQLIESFNVLDNVMIVQKFAGKAYQLSLEKSLNLLDKFGIKNLIKKNPKTLSQGEKQRVALARAIANDAELILADEPTASLESSQGIEIITLLRTLAEKGKCVIVVSHDQRLKNYADRILWLENGMIL